ncbi:MAG: hypothetical protein LBF92_03275 [Synergistaceae bacterium]|jgi:hypothetical protein|nr:hypothetical protein [Synergistaceae bacterium]
MERVSLPAAVKDHPILSVLLAASVGVALGACGVHAPYRQSSLDRLATIVKIALGFIFSKE